MSETKPIKVAAELFYANDMVSFNEFTEASQKYVAHVGKLSDAAAEKLEEMGIHVGDNETKGRNVSSKSKFPFQPVDEDGNDVDPKIIGNGTKAHVLISPYNWSFGKKKGVAAAVKKIIITELVRYTPTDSPEEAEEDDDVL